jgi:hypothetical protein
LQAVVLLQGPWAGTESKQNVKANRQICSDLRWRATKTLHQTSDFWREDQPKSSLVGFIPSGWDRLSQPPKYQISNFKFAADMSCRRMLDCIKSLCKLLSKPRVPLQTLCHAFKGQSKIAQQ